MRRPILRRWLNVPPVEWEARAAAVRAQNRTARGVRKALGFAHPDDPFTF